MSLPQSFATPEDYFENIIAFFKEYQYLYNIANTEILVKKVLDQIDIHRLENLDVYEKDFDLPSNCDVDFLNGFFEKLDKFKIDYEECQSGLDKKALSPIKSENFPVSPKKSYEILYLAKEIADACEQYLCDVVVDFGSGLGYLDQLLFEKTNLKVLGIESNEGHYVNAKKRQRKYHSNSVENVKYVRHTIKSDSSGCIERFLDEKFGGCTGFCIAGLHSCADLTIDAMNLFLKMENAKAIILMPCCYHKMALNCDKFENFPLSRSLKEIFQKFAAFEFLNVPFLRLAAQPPNNNESLDKLVFNLLARAVLQVYAFNHNCKLKRNKRKAVRTKSTTDFPDYAKEALIGFTLIENQPSDSVRRDQNSTFDVEELNSLWRELPSSIFKKAAIFILLQNHLQPVIENFVLFDRIVYLKENGVNNCRFNPFLPDGTNLYHSISCQIYRHHDRAL